MRMELNYFIRNNILSVLFSYLGDKCKDVRKCKIHKKSKSNCNTNYAKTYCKKTCGYCTSDQSTTTTPPPTTTKGPSKFISNIVIQVANYCHTNNNIFYKMC